MSQVAARLQHMENTPKLPEWARDLFVFDTETTGVNTDTARIVSAYIGRLDASGAVTAERSWLIDPGVEIPWQAQKVHGISTEQARAEGQQAPEAVAEIVAALSAALERGVPVVAYNAPYDFSIVHSEALRYGVVPLVNPSPIIDPLVIDKAVDTYRRGKRTLTVTTEHYGVRLDDAHHASADALAAGRLAQAIAQAYPERLDVSAQQLHTDQIGWAQEQADSFIDYMRKTRGMTDFWTSGSWPVR